jgi:hypothetical protein
MKGCGHQKLWMGANLGGTKSTRKATLSNTGVWVGKVWVGHSPHAKIRLEFGQDQRPCT